MKTIQFRIIQFSLFLFSCLALNAQTKSDWKDYETTDYLIHYPSGWDIDTSKIMGTQWIILSPLEDEKDQFRENINLIIESLPKTDISLEEYMESAKGMILKFITDSKIISTESSVINNQPIQKLMFTGKQGQYNLKYIQYYTLKDGNAYILTFSGVQHTFDAYLPFGEAVMNTFSLKR